MLITAEEFFKGLSWEDYRFAKIRKRMEAAGVKEQGFDEESPPLLVYVNHGGWKVKCECGGCERAWESAQWFMCQSCLNGNYKHKYRRVEWPDDKMRKQIEKLLELRPIPNRNWYPGETVADLRKENREHKKELLEVV